MKRRVILLIVTVVSITAMFVATILGEGRPVLGLDLQGGISIVLFPVAGSDVSALNTAAEVIRNRVDGLGIAEPDVQRQGSTIVVSLPGVKDREKAEQLVGETAELRFREVLAQYPWDAEPTSSTTSKGATTTSTGKGSTTTSNGATSTTSSSDAGPGTTISQSTTPGKAAGRTINTAPIAKRYRAVTPTTTAGTTAPGATTPTTIGGLTPTTIPASTTTAPPQAFPGCAKLIADSAPDTDEAQIVVLPDRTQESCYQLGPAVVTGKSIGKADVVYDSTSSQWATNVKFKNNDFVEKIAGPLVNKQVAIELDGVVQSAPTINPGITGRDVEITGDFKQSEAKDLALVLRYGALPVQFDQQKQTVESISPTLGKDQLTAGIVAGLIGLALVALYMLLFYRILGLVVIAGLVLTAMLFFSLLSYLSTSRGLTLTLAGVTGIIVSVGVTVDSYVIYFERLKDEVRSGRTVRSSLEPGFTRSFRTIVAADLVSLLGATVLYLFATSSVRGFAFFLGLSTLIDLLLAWAFMHPLVSVLARRRKLVTLPGVGIAAALDVQGATA